MFDRSAFQNWKRVFGGACVMAGLFLGVMLLVEEVVGPGARFSRPVLAVTVAAFVGYLCTAWIIRHNAPERD